MTATNYELKSTQLFSGETLAAGESVASSAIQTYRSSKYTVVVQGLSPSGGGSEVDVDFDMVFGSTETGTYIAGATEQSPLFGNLSAETPLAFLGAVPDVCSEWSKVMITNNGANSVIFGLKFNEQ